MENKIKATMDTMVSGWDKPSQILQSKFSIK